MKKFFTGFLTVLFSLNFMGCTASVNLVHSYDSEYFYENIEIVINETEVAAIDYTGAPTGYQDEKWKLSAYLPKYFETINLLLPVYDRYELYSETVIKSSGQSNHIWIFRKKIPLANYKNTSVKTTRKNGFYVNTFTVTRPSPFNGVREEFSSIGGDETQTPLSILKNGKFYVTPEGDKAYDLPSLFQAFGYFGDIYANPGLADQLTLNYLMKDSKRLKNAGTAIKTDSGTYYLWKTKFYDGDQTIEYIYHRANSLGWNITALIAAGLVVTAILFFTRNKKPKQKAQDNFPYKPDEYKNLY